MRFACVRKFFFQDLRFSGLENAKSEKKWAKMGRKKPEG